MAEKQLSLHERAMYGRLSDEEWEALAEELRCEPPGSKLYDYLSIFGYADRRKYKPLLTEFLEGEDDEAQNIMALNLFALHNDIALYKDSAIKVIRCKPALGIDDVTRNHSRAVIASAAKEYLAKNWNSDLMAALIAVAEDESDEEELRSHAAAALDKAIGRSEVQWSVGDEEFWKTIEQARLMLKRRESGK